MFNLVFMATTHFYTHILATSKTWVKHECVGLGSKTVPWRGETNGSEGGLKASCSPAWAWRVGGIRQQTDWQESDTLSTSREGKWALFRTHSTTFYSLMIYTLTLRFIKIKRKNNSAVIILLLLPTHYLMKLQFDLLTNPKTSSHFITIGRCTHVIHPPSEHLLGYFSVFISKSLDNFQPSFYYSTF